MKLVLLCLVWMVILIFGFYIKLNVSVRWGKKIYMLWKIWLLIDVIIWIFVYYK